MSKIIYVASPYNHPDDSIRVENYKKVSKYTADLIASGQVAMSPIAYGHPLLDFTEMPYDWEFWSNFCISFLKKCEEMHIFMIDGWDKSRGVAEEIEYCVKNSIPIKYIEP